MQNNVMGVFQGWLAEVEERMPSKSDSHRKSVLYESQNSTSANTITVSNNCAQDRERYGIFKPTQDTSYLEIICSHGEEGYVFYYVYVLALEQPGRQLHRGADFRDSGQSYHQPNPYIFHGRV